MGTKDTVVATSFDYYNGLDGVVVHASVPHGLGTREIAVKMSPRDIVAMGEALKPVLDDPDSGARGHAFWHWLHGRPAPCVMCRASSVLDLSHEKPAVADVVMRVLPDPEAQPRFEVGKNRNE